MMHGFKQYWREHRHKAFRRSAVRGRPAHNRKVRRRWVREWYLDDKRRVDPPHAGSEE